VQVFREDITSLGDRIVQHRLGCTLRLPPPRETVRRLPELRGKNLMCCCTLDKPCHAGVLLELANAPDKSAIERNRRRIRAISHGEARR
jgi:hypothetical protein